MLRSDYPRLVRLADTYNLWTDDTANNLGKFGVGDGETTFVLPNWVDRMEQLSDTAGGTVEAGLPNITGTFTLGDGDNSIIAPAHNASPTGAFSFIPAPTNGSPDLGTPFQRGQTVKFDAQDSNGIYGNSTTVQPPTIKRIPIMRY